MYKEKSCGVLIKKNGKYLFLKSIRDHWNIPKGRIVDGESETEAALREVLEETGLIKIKLSDHRYETEYYSSRFDVLKTVVVFLGILADEQQVVLSKDHKEFEWVGYDKAVELVKETNAKDATLKALEEFEKK